MRRALLALALAAVSCGPPKTPPFEWEAIDKKAVLAGFDAPTGALEKETGKDVVNAIVGDPRVAGGKALAGALGKVVDDVQDGLGTTEGALRVTGAHAYIRVSCPGQDLDVPDTTFAFGEVRLDAPDIDSDQLGQGDVLLTFRGCVTGPLHLEGTSPAYYDVNPKRFLASLRVTVDRGGAPQELALDARIGGGVREVLFEPAAGLGTFVVDLTGYPKTLSIRASNATVDCTLKEGGGTCGTDGGLTFEL